MSVKQKACALRYPKDADAPFISVSGRGTRAEKIIQIAKENKIPLVKDDALVEVLSIQEVGSLIPEETYSAIATIFAFIAKMEDGDGGKELFEGRSR